MKHFQPQLLLQVESLMQRNLSYWVHGGSLYDLLVSSVQERPSIKGVSLNIYLKSKLEFLFVHPNLFSINIPPIDGCLITGLIPSTLNLCPRLWYVGEHLSFRMKLFSCCAASCSGGEERLSGPEVSAVSSVADN